MPYVSKRARHIVPGESIDLEEWFSEIYSVDDATEQIDEVDSEDWSDETRLYDLVTSEFSQVESVEVKDGVCTLVTSHTRLTVNPDRSFVTDRFYSEDEEIH